MKDILKKTEFTENDITNIIVNQWEESLHLEFKSSESLGKTDGKKRELSKDISAFANSDGGMIFYGIKELDHKASELSFVDGRDVTKEWIEQVLNSNIYPKIPDLRIHPIRFEGSMESSVYAVGIPASSAAPHMSADKRYYRRYNFESVPMEEPDLTFSNSFFEDMQKLITLKNLLKNGD